MRLMIALAVLGTVVATAGFAADTAQQSSMKTCAASWKAVPDADKKKTKYTDYMGTCMKAPATKPSTAVVAKPDPAATMTMTATKPASKSEGAMKMAAPAEGKAKCKDGTTVTYKNRQGTCSGHGGVATWM